MHFNCTLFSWKVIRNDKQTTFRETAVGEWFFSLSVSHTFSIEHKPNCIFKAFFRHISMQNQCKTHKFVLMQCFEQKYSGRMADYSHFKYFKRR